MPKPDEKAIAGDTSMTDHLEALADALPAVLFDVDSPTGPVVGHMSFLEHEELAIVEVLDAEVSNVA